MQCPITSFDCLTCEMACGLQQKASPYGKCPDCGSTEKYEEATSSTDEYRNGISLTCLGCGFAIAGPNEQTVRTAMATLRNWNKST